MKQDMLRLRSIVSTHETDFFPDRLDKTDVISVFNLRPLLDRLA